MYGFYEMGLSVAKWAPLQFRLVLGLSSFHQSVNDFN